MSRRVALALLLVVIAAALAYRFIAALVPLPPQEPPTAVAPPKRDPGYYRHAFKPHRLYLPTLIEKYGDRYSSSTPITIGSSTVLS